MAITPLPTPVPSSADPANFDARADEFLTALPAFATEANALGEEINDNAAGVALAAAQIEDRANEVAAAALAVLDAAGLVGRSNSGLTVGAGTKNITLLVAKPGLVELNKRVAIVQLSDPSIRMFGTISSVTSSTVFAVTVVSSGAYGSGSYSAWQIIDAAFLGTAATKEDVWAGVIDVASITPKTLKEAQASQAFTEPGAAGTFTFNGDNGWSFHTTLTGAGKTVGLPSNFKPGQSGRIRFVVGAGAGALAFHTAWKFSFGAPTTSAVDGVVFVISYFVHDASNIESVYIADLQA